WSRDGTILFVPYWGAGLYRVSASGGAPSPVVSPEKSKHTFYREPHFLPDGRHFTYFASGDEASTGTYFASLDGRQDKLILRTTDNITFASGFLIYPVPNGPIASLMAQAFDPGTGQVKSDPQALGLQSVYMAYENMAAFDVSATGLLVYGAYTANGGAGSQHVLW